MTSTIQDYAIIGDGRSCALIAKTGSIDFLCRPLFDSDACFAAIFGGERHGHWRISTAGYVSQTTRSYRNDTTILETEHVTDTFRPRDPTGRWMKISRGWHLLVATLPLFLLSGCDVLNLGVMNHAGPITASQWHLYVIVGIVLVFVAGPVLLLTPLIAWHYRLSNKNSTFRPNWRFSWTLEGFIWIPPIGIVIGLGVVLWHYTHTLDPYRPITSSQPALEVQAVALDWKWLFIYPDQHIAAINELVIPVGRTIHISLTSGTVMQALLIPRLAGQIYTMAGMTTQLNLAASRAGAYRGENTQFNGSGFQSEKFNVTALLPADYDRWVARVRASSHPFDGAAYAELFRKSSPPHPIIFSSVPQRLFQKILVKSREPKS